jgi:hypothetical protein
MVPIFNGPIHKGVFPYIRPLPLTIFVSSFESNTEKIWYTFMSDPQSAPKFHSRMLVNEPFENLAELALRGPMISVSLEPLKTI